MVGTSTPKSSAMRRWLSQNVSSSKTTSTLATPEGVV